MAAAELTNQKPPMPQHPQRESLVGVATIARHLGVKDTTIYSLVRGVRGWQAIEPLPVHRVGRNLKRPRFAFSLEEVKDWARRTKFKRVNGVGRRKAKLS